MVWWKFWRTSIPEPVVRAEPRIDRVVNAQPIAQKRDYDFGRPNRTAGEFIRASNRPHWEVTREQGDTLRRNGRFLAENDPHVGGYRRDLVSQILGPQGLVLDSRVDTGGEDAQPDKRAQKLIESAWREWSLAENCSLNRFDSWIDVQELTLKTWATDGELGVRLIPDQSNGWGLSLQLLEADHLDVRLNGTLRNGNELVNGIEIERATGRMVAFHIRIGHPFARTRQQAAQIERVPAEDMLWLFSRERITQMRGITWLHSAGLNINTTNRWIDAAGVNARAGASNMGFIEEEEVDVNDEPLPGEENADGTIPQELMPGVIVRLPKGKKFKEFNPGYPDQATDPFARTLQKISAKALGHSYATFTGDMSDANYSSARFGALSERDFWRVSQRQLIDRLARPIFMRWLPLQLLNGKVALPFRDLSRFSKHIWRARGWESVDPQKETGAIQRALAMGITSRRRVVAQRGGDLDEILDELAEETQRIEELGIKGPEMPELEAETTSDDSSNQNRSSRSFAKAAKPNGHAGGRSAVPSRKNRRRGKAHANPADDPDDGSATTDG